MEVTSVVAPPVVAHALSCPTRFEMLRAVVDAPLSVGELAAVVGVHESTASGHVRYLVEAGLVEVTPDANRRLVRARARVIQFDLVGPPGPEGSASPDGDPSKHGGQSLDPIAGRAAPLRGHQ